MENEDDIPALSEEALTALEEHYKEEEERKKAIATLGLCGGIPKENLLFDENWQLSQFWYDEVTVQTLVKAIDRSILEGDRVALISCPTLFIPTMRAIGDRATVMLLEFDRRFEIYKPYFLFYDYNAPTNLPSEILNSYDMVVADPPFLSEECITKTAETIKLLSKNRIIVCTGSVMKKNVERLLDLKLCKFQPKHRKNLANDFSCFANFAFDDIV